ncbi:hypothetical protein MJ575_17635 [Klebsiella pneumoniae]|nr:hypothetical protein MJ575_17635 [Klebsiella pneumoniae]
MTTVKSVSSSTCIAMQEEAPGIVFWHNDGWTIFSSLETFVRSKLKEWYQGKGSVHDGPCAVGKNRPLEATTRCDVHHLF